MIFSILLQFAPVFYNFASVVCGPIIIQFISWRQNAAFTYIVTHVAFIITNTIY